uniref:Uncharacterized protein n=1 Tax=Plectus sambesii TaxID=2011161 RepID=A0A914VH65_9BILA
MKRVVRRRLRREAKRGDERVLVEIDDGRAPSGQRLIARPVPRPPSPHARLLSALAADDVDRVDQLVDPIEFSCATKQSQSVCASRNVKQSALTAAPFEWSRPAPTAGAT